jgi:hypothetical protein
MRLTKAVAAQPGHASRALATAASASPLVPVHRVAPVAGSMDIRSLKLASVFCAFLVQ